mmetsp:Transcript_13938/g.30051  ORF Transcript_13938/g.30051 Transcript_13938/m.30051 type:complete len:85 (+) Transcript_13938:3-257(+)
MLPLTFYRRGWLKFTDVPAENSDLSSAFDINRCIQEYFADPMIVEDQSILTRNAIQSDDTKLRPNAHKKVISHLVEVTSVSSQD